MVTLLSVKAEIRNIVKTPWRQLIFGDRLIGGGRVKSVHYARILLGTTEGRFCNGATQRWWFQLKINVIRTCIKRIVRVKSTRITLTVLLTSRTSTRKSRSLFTCLPFLHHPHFVTSSFLFLLMLSFTMCKQTGNTTVH